MRVYITYLRLTYYARSFFSPVPPPHLSRRERATLNVERAVEREPARREDEKERRGGRRGGGEKRGAADRIMGTHTPEHVCLASCGGPEVSAAHYGAP